jgi:type IX secretion system PorP/SprF family membrane protein
VIYLNYIGLTFLPKKYKTCAVLAMSVQICAVLWAMPASAQLNVQMSQYMFNGMVVNPAHTGEHEALNIQALVRMQWWGVTGAPNTQIVSVDGNLYSPASGIGLVLMRDALGSLSNLGAYANYAFRIRLNDLNDRLCFGLSGGFIQNSYNAYDPLATGGFGQPLYDAAFDNVLSNVKPVYLPDFKFGIMYEMRDVFYLGISAVNLGSFFAKAEDSSMVVQTPVAMFHGGANIVISRNFALRPFVLYMQPVNRTVGTGASIKVFPPAGTLDVGLAAVIANRFWVGASYRTAIKAASMSNALTILAEVWVTPAIRLGYSYDLPMSGISGALGGSHEVSLGFTPVKKVTRYKNARDF